MYCLRIECDGSSIPMRKSRRARRKALATAPTLGMGTMVTFRAEVMPGRETLERTFEVTRVLANGRVELAKLHGQHSVAEFESHSMQSETD